MSYSTYILFFLCILHATSTYSCEPVSLDWRAFESNYDLNHDHHYDLNEFRRVIDFEPYPWPADSRFATKDKHDLLFQWLDKNNDKQLSAEELAAIHQLFENPCLNLPK